MSIVKVVGTGRSVNAERALFVGPRIPQDIKSMTKRISQINKKTFRKILHNIVEGLILSDDQDKDILTPEDKIGSSRIQMNFQELVTDDVDEEALQIVYGGIYSLLLCALKKPIGSLKADVFKEDLAELNIPTEFIFDLESIVYGPHRSRLETSILDSRPSLPKLDNLRWRVDTTILTSVLSRVLKPSVMMEMTLSNGNIHTFEVPISKFQELRYNISYVLKEMESLEKRSILRLAD